ncbi:hypothetical protein L798_01764 [Zootermopsis nevadensis]|uniref:Uncharacterized protein n=1 Tax=Zootermopsis nevadensis TaxID=136037 RepID=A0A067QSW4_ZOONE|nr:hypothetical protein L798_01764 [Zootermopsis nevadensis]
MSLTARGSLSPSLISAPSPIALRLACCTSEWRAQIIFPPLASIETAGSSRPTFTMMLPSSNPNATLLKPLMQATVHTRSSP